MNNKEKLLTLLDTSHPSLAGLEALIKRGAVDEATAMVVEHYRTRTEPHYLFEAKECEALEDEQIFVDAQKVMDHIIWGHDFDGPIDWRFNPTTETSRDNEWSWSLFRTLFWQPLARAYALSKDERYVVEFCAQLKSFYEAWPAKEFIEWDEMDKSSPFPGHAWRTIESGIRIYTTWLPVLEVFRSSPSFDEESWATFLCSIHDHGTFLHKHYSNHNRSSNWLSMEASALLQLGIMFPEMKDAQMWREEGYRRVMHEIVYCFDSEGAHMEHTPIYHMVAALTFTQATQLCILNNIPVAPYAMPLLTKAAEYVMAVMKPDFSTPMIGDADRTTVKGRITDPSKYEGMNLSFFPDDLNELRAYFNWMARLTGREDFAYIASAGERGTPPAQLDYRLDESAFYVMRTGWTERDSYLHLLGVKLERGERSTHSHNDTGHLELMVGGEDVLIDSGRYIYNSSIWKDWRAYFTGSLAHNTVYIDNHYMGKIPNVDRVRGVRTFCHAFERHDTYLMMDISHNGYVLMSDPIFHRRKVVFFPESGSTVVVDHLTGEGREEHDIRFTWNFASPAVERLSDQVSRYTTPGKQVFTKYAVATHPGQRQASLAAIDGITSVADATGWQSQLLCGSEDPKGGWVSYGYPVREATGQIQECFVSRTDITMVTVIAKDRHTVTVEASGADATITIDEVKIVVTEESMEVLA